MAKKETRISINKLESTMKELTVTIPMNGADGVDIVIRRSLPLMSVMQFVEDVVSSVVDFEEKKYTPEVRDFAIYVSVLTKYANFNLPQGVEKQYDLIYNTDALSQVMEHINHKQFEELVNAIDERIAHELAIMESAVSAKSNELLSRIDEMVSQYEELFSGIADTDLSAVMHNIASMERLDEKTLAHAVLDAQSENATGGKVVSFPKPKE